MKKYDYYYETESVQCWDELKKSEITYGKEWWKKNADNGRFDLIGEFPMTTIRSVDEKNDIPIYENHTNVLNSEWVILHNMFISVLIDYIKEHCFEHVVDIYRLNISLDKPKWKLSLCDKKDEEINFPDSDPYIMEGVDSYVSDQETLDKYDELSQLLYFHFVEFCRRHFVDLNKMDYLSFSVENVKDSISYGGWSPSSDSSFTLYNKGSKNIVCSM